MTTLFLHCLRPSNLAIPQPNKIKGGMGTFIAYYMLSIAKLAKANKIMERRRKEKENEKKLLTNIQLHIHS